MDRIVEFLFEAGMLKKTPRSGWQFLGSGSESVAEHVFRTSLIAFVLARLDGNVDLSRVCTMALVHDLPEARTGDLNYMNQKYVNADEELAARHMTDGLPFGDELLSLLEEYRARTTPEAIVVYDADQLEFLLELKEQIDVGNPQAKDWVPFVMRRLKTDSGRRLAELIMAGNSANWWFDQDSSWWVRGGKK